MTFDLHGATRLGWLILEKSSRSNNHGWPEEDRCELHIVGGAWQHYDRRDERDRGPLARSRVLKGNRRLPPQSNERAFDALATLSALAKGEARMEERLWLLIWQEFHEVTLPWLREEVLPNRRNIYPSERNRRIKIQLDLPELALSEHEQEDTLFVELTLASGRMERARAEELARERR